MRADTTGRHAGACPTENPLKYALVTHVPTYAGQSAGVVRLTEAFRDDLLAEASALRTAGFDVTLATPRHASPDEKSLARERFVDVRLADHRIADAPLPAYANMRQFLAAKSALADAIEAATNGAGVVQMGAGGHPMALGQFAWPLVDSARHKRIFVFAGDPLPARQRGVRSGHNPAKQLAKMLAFRQFAAFCRQAVTDSDLVFAHDAAVEKRFARQWHDRCHTFATHPIGDGDLAGPVLMAHRQRRTLDAQHPVRVVAVPSAGTTGGLDHVIRAIAKARRLSIPVSLRFAPGTAVPNLAALRTELGLTDGVDTSTASLTDTFDEADLFVAAPLTPGENPSIFTAAARGLPILTYAASPTDVELVAAGGAATVERGDANALSQALIDLCRDRQKLAGMAESSRGWAAGVTRDSVHRARAALVRSAVGL